MNTDINHPPGERFPAMPSCEAAVEWLTIDLGNFRPPPKWRVSAVPAASWSIM